MKIAITGGAGFIGSNLAKYFMDKHEVLVVDCFRSDKTFSNGNLRSFGHFKNLLGFDISNGLYYWAATLHNVGFVLMILLIIAHLAAFIPKINRNLLPGMFSGKVDSEYATHRHSLWKAKSCEEK